MYKVSLVPEIKEVRVFKNPFFAFREDKKEKYTFSRERKVRTATIKDIHKKDRLSMWSFSGEETTYLPSPFLPDSKKIKVVSEDTIVISEVDLESDVKEKEEIYYKKIRSAKKWMENVSMEMLDTNFISVNLHFPTDVKIQCKPIEGEIVFNDTVENPNVPKEILEDVPECNRGKSVFRYRLAADGRLAVQKVGGEIWVWPTSESVDAQAFFPKNGYYDTLAENPEGFSFLLKTSCTMSRSRIREFRFAPFEEFTFFGEVPGGFEERWRSKHKRPKFVDMRNAWTIESYEIDPEDYDKEFSESIFEEEEGNPVYDFFLDHFGVR